MAHDLGLRVEIVQRGKDPPPGRHPPLRKQDNAGGGLKESYRSNAPISINSSSRTLSLPEHNAGLAWPANKYAMDW